MAQLPMSVGSSYPMNNPMNKYPTGYPIGTIPQTTFATSTVSPRYSSTGQPPMLLRNRLMDGILEDDDTTVHLFDKLFNIYYYNKLGLSDLKVHIDDSLQDMKTYVAVKAPDDVLSTGSDVVLYVTKEIHSKFISKDITNPDWSLMDELVKQHKKFYEDQDWTVYIPRNIDVGGIGIPTSDHTPLILILGGVEYCSIEMSDAVSKLRRVLTQPQKDVVHLLSHDCPTNSRDHILLLSKIYHIDQAGFIAKIKKSLNKRQLSLLGESFLKGELLEWRPILI